MIEKKRIKKIKRRVRSKIYGTPERPRLSVFKSNRFIYAQIIDDLRGITLVSVSEKDLKDKIKDGMTKKQKAYLLGQVLAEISVAKNIKKVAFDRNYYKYHGRVKELADGARAGGLDF
jgi:large subunit ribosomal protein L18